MAFIALDVDVLRLEFWALLSELKEFQKDKVIYLKGQCHEKLKLISQYRTTWRSEIDSFYFNPQPVLPET